jgi:hypothetical protein
MIVQWCGNMMTSDEYCIWRLKQGCRRCTLNLNESLSLDGCVRLRMVKINNIECNTCEQRFICLTIQ